jgi:hypothetical protein
MYLNLNLFVIFWFTTTFSVLILGLITIYFNQYLPQFVSNLVKFGKLLNEQKVDSKNGKNSKKLINLIEIPKRYFIHFYIFAFIYHLIIILLLFQTNCFSKSDQILC